MNSEGCDDANIKSSNSTRIHEKLKGRGNREESPYRNVIIERWIEESNS
jgi:hypothetical protein